MLFQGNLVDFVFILLLLLLIFTLSHFLRAVAVGPAILVKSYNTSGYKSE